MKINLECHENPDQAINAWLAENPEMKLSPQQRAELRIQFLAAKRLLSQGWQPEQSFCE